MRPKLCFFLVFFSVVATSQSQDINYARKVIDTLTAPGMHGRGYVSKGDKIAADFIAEEFKKAGLQQLDKNFFQTFKIQINTFPGEITLALDGHSYMPGKDFLVHPASPSFSGEHDIVWLNKTVIENEQKLAAFKNQNLDNKFLLVDGEGVENPDWKTIIESIEQNPLGAKGIIVFSTKKLTHLMAMRQFEYPIIYLRKVSPYGRFSKVDVKIEAALLKDYQTQNVLGYVPGKEKADSFIVFSAHYDHLGRMGKATYFPGANDNASGTALLLNLAKHYAKQPSKYSVAFMAFGAEEVGIIGSKIYTENPAFPLRKIKFMLNVDIMGTGDEGITVVNASEHKKAFEHLVKINEEKNYLPKVKERGKASISDHHWFSEKGVPAFFIYTMGGIQAYHDIYDKAETLPLTEYEDCFRLLTDFVTTFEQ